MKIRILHKGLAFLLCALLLQAALFFQILSLVQKAEMHARKAEAESQAILYSGLIMSEFAHSIVRIVPVLYNGNRGRLLHTESTASVVKDLLAKARDLDIDDPSARKLFTEEEALAQSQLQLEADLVKSDISVNAVPLSLVAKYSKEVMTVLNQFESVRTHLRFAVAHLHESAESERAAQAQLKTQVMVGFLLEVLLCVVLITAFLQNISNRLSSLVVAAQTIPTGQRYVRKVTGGDEIAYLDGVLYKAVEDLRLAEERRQSIMHMVAHDLRAPLASAKLTLERIIGESTVAGAVSEGLKGLRSRLNRLVSLVEDLLTVDKLESGKLELNCSAADINAIVETAIEDVQTLALEKQVVLENRVEKAIIPGDKDRLTQVLTNLLSNAIRYSPSGASVEVTSQLNDEQLTVSVTDHGAGIPQDKQAKLFEKFYRADSQTTSDGFGLGLAICKLIVSEHSGEIGVRSQPGQGSSFWFTLPIKIEEA